MKYETIEQLVQERRGYKYLRKNGKSPYQGYKYVLRKGKKFQCALDTDVQKTCGAGWNLATLPWIIKNCRWISSARIAEFSIPEDAQIVVPVNTDGKFRTDKMVYERLHNPKDIFPQVFKALDQYKRYKPVNPIQAESLPPEQKIISIMEEIGGMVSGQLRVRIWAQIGDQAKAQAQVHDRIWDQLLGQVLEQTKVQVWDRTWPVVMDHILDQDGDQAWVRVRDQLLDQVSICAYHAIAEFMKLKYNHPVFSLVRLGVMVVAVSNKYKVFGKNGKFLGEYDA